MSKLKKIGSDFAEKLDKDLKCEIFNVDNVNDVQALISEFLFDKQEYSKPTHLDFEIKDILQTQIKDTIMISIWWKYKPCRFKRTRMMMETINYIINAFRLDVKFFFYRINNS